MIRFAFAVFIALLAGCASQQPVPALDLAAAPPEVAAQYTTSRSASEAEHAQSHHDHAAHSHARSTVEWRMFRAASRIDIDNLSAHTGETWQRDGKTLFMRKVFHDDRKAIEYRMDDFAVLAMKPSWQKQALLIDAGLLATLTEKDQRWIDGHPARVYRGTVGTQQIEVVWLVDVNLPQSITRNDADGELIEKTTLVALQPLATQPWAYRSGDDYEVIDYADLGDRERDQFVMRVQSQLPGGDVHRH